MRTRLKSRKPINKKKSPYSSLAISLLRKSQSKHTRRGLGIKEKIILPKIFSIIDDPEGFLSILNNIDLNNIEKLREIYVDHSTVQEIDLAAESILDFLIMELKKSKRNQKKFNISGILPNDVQIDRYIRAIGIVKNLDIKTKLIDSQDDDRLRIFKMRNKSHYETSLTQPDWKSTATTEFVKHINDCLQDHNKKLIRTAEGRLASYIGEILNNAEDHSGYDESTIVGYLDNASANHICEIAIFNFGKTIAQTFHEMPENSYTNIEISEYIESHTRKTLFSKEWSKNDLLTLVALQGHISSKNYHKDQDRGQGTVDLIDFFQKIHKKCVSEKSSLAEMAILSGNTHIYFDGKYKMSADETGRKVIAFNDKNDLSQKPDSRYVRNLGKLNFPGTIISIRFPMKAENTEPLVEST
jgi:hypothetical protein